MFETISDCARNNNRFTEKTLLRNKRNTGRNLSNIQNQWKVTNFCGTHYTFESGRMTVEELRSIRRYCWNHAYRKYSKNFTTSLEGTMKWTGHWRESFFKVSCEVPQIVVIKSSLLRIFASEALIKRKTDLQRYTNISVKYFVP